MMCPKAENDPPKTVFTYQKTKTAGGQRANKRIGTSIRWIETGILRDDSAIFSSPAKNRNIRFKSFFSTKNCLGSLDIQQSATLVPKLTIKLIFPCFRQGS